MTTASPTVHLVDASPYVFRAFYSLPSSITTPEGAPANAAYGFASFLLKLLDSEEPSHLALAFDGSLTSSFRNELYPEYKAHRESPPEELVTQLEDCRALGRALGFATFIDDRYEADDILATLWRQHREQGRGAVVVTSDKDLAQLVDAATQVFDFAKDTRYDRQAVEEKFGVRPEQIPDYLGLTGDSVDNIPGVAGVGPKTASALLAEMATLEEALENLERVAALPVRGAKSLAKKLDEQREMALLSKRLATVACDGPFEASLEELEHRGADAGEIDPLFERLGFGGIRDRISRWR